MIDYYQQNIRLNIGHDIISSLHTIQYDTAREFHFYIDDYTIPSDAEIRVYIKKPSGKEIYNPCLLSDEEIIVYPTTQMFAECGLHIGQLQIVKEQKTLTSFLFHVMVHESFAENAIPSTNEFLIFDSLIIEAREIIAAEASRVEAENFRNTNESDRITNENNRVKAENLREQAEQLRQQHTKAAIDNCEAARQNANIAADSANSATQNADESAANANAAAQNANAAATNANNVSEQLIEQAENGTFSSTISDVSVITGDPGTEASVQNIGTAKDANLVFTIPKGEIGEPFSIKKIYTSIEEMNINFASDGLAKGQFVLINTGNVDDMDNAKLYVKGETEYQFICKLVDDTATITFDAPETRTNIFSGESLKTLFGKIAKWFSDLKSVAFSGSYNDLFDKPVIPNSFKSTMTIPVSSGWIKFAKLLKSSMLRTDIPDSETLTISFSCTPTDGSGVYDQSCKFIITETWAGSKIIVLSSLHVKKEIITKVRKVFDSEDQAYYLEFETNVSSCPCKLDISFESGETFWEPITDYYI